jgi:aminoglycoside 6'-N-acetyltransferase I
MVLAVDDGFVVGMASAVEYFHPDKPQQLWINEVGVTPLRRNERIGRQLIESLIAIGREMGCAYVWLGTERNNLPAQRCFASVPNGECPSEFLLYEWDGATEPSDTPELP